MSTTYVFDFDEMPDQIIEFHQPTRVTVEYRCGHYTQFTVVGQITSQTKHWCDHCIVPQKVKLLVNRDAAPKQPGAPFQIGDIVRVKESGTT